MTTPTEPYRSKMLQGLAKVTSETLRRFDSAMSGFGWNNPVTGMGTPRDKTSYTGFGLVQFLSPSQLSNIYHGDDLASRMVDIVPDEAMREGFDVDFGDEGRNVEFSQAAEALGIGKKFADGMRWGRLHGIGGLVIGADDGRPASSPLVPERVRKVDYLYEVDKRYIQPFTRYEDPDDPRLGQVETYWISPTSIYAATEGVRVIHESRMILFSGATTGILEKEINLGFDHSVLQRVFEALRSFNTGWKSVEVLLADGNQAVFKMAGLREAIGADGDELLKKRLQVVDLYRSVLRAITIDAGDPDTGKGGEEFERHNVQWAGIPDVLDRYMLRLAAAVQIPATILYGQSPAGMDATGDADFRWFYNRIKSHQKLNISPQLRKLARIMVQTRQLRSAKTPDFIKVTWPNLWCEAPGVEAKRKSDIAVSDAAYVTAGVLTPQEVAIARFGGPTFGEDIQLTPEALEIRQKLLKDNLEDELTPPDPEAPVVGAFGSKPNPAAAEAVKASIQAATSKPTVASERNDAADDLVDIVGRAPRCVIAGGPRTGKSTVAARAGERHSRDVRSTDALIGTHSWSDASNVVSGWLDDESYVIEGVATLRALRKWLVANPEKKLDATVVWFGRAVSPQTEGQRAMSKGVRKVWNEIRGELEKRGVTIIERDS